MKPSKTTSSGISLSQGDSSHITEFHHCLHRYMEPCQGRDKHVTTSLKRVQSIQCMETAAKKTARAWAVEYFSWLQTRSLGLVQTDLPYNGKTRFRAGGLTLLGMTEDPFRHVNLSSWLIESGVLLHQQERKASVSRFTFLTAEQNGRDLLFTAVESFAPALPWKLYRMTQGIIHPFVMNRFAHHIGKPDRSFSCLKDRYH
ncbi:hypothetical protein [Salisediminibacterium selenitireducens]|uniref:DUF2867 domain-containing protein n=1 Tax=Bacillus selenitireducens (strain ATCC 700615 / DSM 15326 / MLS10) TaxID=439292 RepID=D6XUA3_BACIE|nr:hypothetical protein [Salisediminibacterium selenitireducens]ADH99389.1 hypothetical protein Bsel_1885 [[Bacillus] selenitireducens MLS10]